MSEEKGKAVGLHIPPIASEDAIAERLTGAEIRPARLRSARAVDAIPKSIRGRLWGHELQANTRNHDAMLKAMAAAKVA